MTNPANRRERLFRLALLSLSAAMIAVCAFVTVPVPDVPFTLQLFGIYLALFLLGGRDGTLAVLLYLSLGAVGAPVFAGFRGGVAVFAGPTGGFLLGFLPMALLFSLLLRVFPKRPAFTALSAALSLLLCYGFGTAWFLLFYRGGTVSLLYVLSRCVLPYLLPDAVKIFLAYRLSLPLGRLLLRRR